MASLLIDLRLPLDLVLNGFFDKPYSQNIFDFDSLAGEIFLVKRNVDVAPHLAILHIGLTDTERFQKFLKLLDSQFAVFRVGDIWVGDYL